MFDLRQKGMRSLFTLSAGGVLVVWFLFAVWFAVEILRLMNYDQVNFTLYLLALALALVFRSNTPRTPVSASPRRFHWVELVQKANLDTVAVAGVMLTVIWATKDKAISRQFVGGFLLLTWVLMVLLNRYLPALLGHYSFRGQHALRTLWVGELKMLRERAHWFTRQQQLGIHLVGYLDIPAKGDPVAAADAAEIAPRLGSVNELEALLQAGDI